MYLHGLHIVLITGCTLDLCWKKKSISGAVRLCENSEACSEGVAGLVEAAEPAAGSTLVGEISRCSCCTSSSAECLSKPVKSKSSPELGSSRRLIGALCLAVGRGSGCCAGAAHLPLPHVIMETGQFTVRIVVWSNIIGVTCCKWVYLIQWRNQYDWNIIIINSVNVCNEQLIY